MDKKVNLVIFTNKHKKKENHPDFRVYKSEPRENSSEENSSESEAQAVKSTEVEEELI